MRYQVPQFIEIEDKIFGPLTVKQFVYLAGGAALSYLIYYTLNKISLPFLLIVVLIIPVAGFAAALAFYKVNGKPFIDVVESAVKYFFGSKLYIWKKEDKPVTKKEEGQAHGQVIVPRLADSKLKDLAWNLNISGEKNKSY
jgi:hypothetical protein